MADDLIQVAQETARNHRRALGPKQLDHIRFLVWLGKEMHLGRTLLEHRVRWYIRYNCPALDV